MRRPENTPEALALAVEEGAHGVELDTHLTADGVAVVRHDLLVDGRPTRALEAAELAALGVPTLLECLDAVAGAGAAAGTRPWVLVEIKSSPGEPALAAPPDAAVDAVAAVLRAHPLGGRCVVESFDRAVLAEAAARLPEVPRAVLADAPTTAAGSPFMGGRDAGGAAWADPDPVRAATALGAVAIAAEHAWLDTDLADRAGRAGLATWAWTVNSPADADRALALGAQVLVTDDPAAMLRHLAARPGPGR